jgi:PAS domain S-box-containing protein
MAQVAREAPRAIRVVVDSAYAPYSFRSDEGELQGIVIDQWRVWERKTGIKVEIHALDWSEALGRMRAGEFDVIDDIVETAERRAYFDFTPPYATVEASIFFRSDISGVADLASLKGFPVGVKAGDQHVSKLMESGVTTVIPFRNFRDLFEAARQHKINVFLADVPSALYLLNKMGLEAEFRHSPAIFRDELRRAVRKGDASLLQTVSQGFAAINPSDLRQIDQKWFGYAVDGYRRYFLYAGYAAAAAILFATVLVAWNRALRKGILQRTAALGESEQRLRQIAENIREVFWMATPGMDEVLYLSPAYESIWGRSLESLRRRPESFFEAIHVDDRERAAGIIRGRREQGFDIEYRIVRPDGSMRWIRDRRFPVKDTSGKVYRIAGVSEDITERKEFGEALRQSESDLTEAQRVARIGSWSFDIAANTVRWSEELYRIFDVEKTAFGGTHEAFLSRVLPEDRMRVLQANAQARASGEPYELEYAIKTRSGALRHIREVGHATKDAAGAVSGLFGIAQDITESKHAETALRDSGARLQALSRRLVELQESERRELSRELHDRVGQTLTATRINMDMIRSRLSEHDDPVIRERNDDSLVLIESAFRAIENVMYELRPPMIDEYGPIVALQWYAKKFANRTAIRVEVRGREDRRCAPEIELSLFRIAQEALNNVARHAQARQVVIELRATDRDVELNIEDDGVGFDPKDDGAEKSGFGFITMRERSEALGGTFEAESRKGKGTRITVRVPRRP